MPILYTFHYFPKAGASVGTAANLPESKINAEGFDVRESDCFEQVLHYTLKRVI